MVVAFELKMTLSELYERMDKDEFEWWLAWFKVRKEKESKNNTRRTNLPIGRNPFTGD